MIAARSSVRWAAVGWAAINPHGYTAPMRLTPAEVAEIDDAKAALPPGTRVALFGSRTDDIRRGGDIDLLVETATAHTVTGMVRQQIQLRAELYWRLGERKIDLLTTTFGQHDRRAVVVNARRDAIELTRTWLSAQMSLRVWLPQDGRQIDMPTRCVVRWPSQAGPSRRQTMDRLAGDRQ